MIAEGEPGLISGPLYSNPSCVRAKASVVPCGQKALHSSRKLTLPLAEQGEACRNRFVGTKSPPKMLMSTLETVCKVR